MSNKTSEASSDGRRAQRYSLFLGGTIQLESSNNICPVRIRNLSATGLLAQGELHPPPGMRVVIELRNIGAVLGEIVWVAEREFGINFDVPLDPNVVRIPYGKSNLISSDYFKPFAAPADRRLR